VPPRNRAEWGWRALAGVGAVCLVAVYLADLGQPLTNYDEPLYAEFIRAMDRGGSWFRLEYQGAETLQRPPTSVAVYAAVASIVPGEIGLRLGPLLFTVVAIVGVGVAVARVYGDRWAGFAAAAVTAGVPSVHVYGRLLLSDPPFVALALGALIATIAAQRRPRYVVWAAALLGAGFAVKSFAAAVPLVTLAPGLAMAWRRHGSAARPGRAAIAFTALAAPYFIAGFAVHGGRFWDEHIGVMLIDRASGDLAPLIGIGGPGAYLEHLWRADGPLVTILLLGAIAGAGAWSWRRRDAELGVAAVAAALTFVLLSAISTRLAHYLLVFYPMAAVCAGGLVARAAPALAANANGARGIAVALGIAVFAQGVARGPFDAGAVPSWGAKELGEAIRETFEPGRRCYAIDWYAPALGYYADRPFTMLTTVPEVGAMLARSDPFAQAGNVAVVPPWPEGTFILVGRESEFPPPGVEIVNLVTGARGFRLAEVRASP
jgi:4-amino-4-deoxy-L-arabinose transferase-like glycosyltransferase